MNFQEISKYYHNGRLDSMRLSLGMRWEEVVDIIFSEISTLNLRNIDAYEVQKENLSLEEEVESLEGMVNEINATNEYLQGVIDKHEVTITEFKTQRKERIDSLNLIKSVP